MKLLIFGNGQIAELAEFYFREDKGIETAAFVVDGEHLSDPSFKGKPVVALETVSESLSPEEHEVFVALSYRHLNRLRAQKVAECKALGYRLTSYVSTRITSWSDLEVGENCFILEQQNIQPYCKIGNNVFLWSGNHIGHHSVIEDNCYVTSHVVISGNCRIGQGSFLGVNATLRDGITLGPECFVAMNAAVNNDLEEGSMVMTQGSKVIPADDRRARALRRQYFGL